MFISWVMLSGQMASMKQHKVCEGAVTGISSPDCHSMVNILKIMPSDMKSIMKTSS